MCMWIQAAAVRCIAIALRLGSPPPRLAPFQLAALTLAHFDHAAQVWRNCAAFLRWMADTLAQKQALALKSLAMMSL